MNKLNLGKYEDRYKKFVTHSKRIWVNVLLHRQVRELLENQCEVNPSYRGEIVIEDSSPVGLQEYKYKQRAGKSTSPPKPIKLTGKNLLDFVDSSTGGGSEWMLEWSLVTTIGLFESFINDIAKMAYLEYPTVFLMNKEKSASEQENYKLLTMLIESETKEETLEKYVEEKLRGIFYGKPIDVFTGGKGKDGKLRLDTAEMAITCENELDEYVEITARRNVITHNMGKVDAKYLRETKESHAKNRLSQGDRTKVSENYLFDALKVIDKLAYEYKRLVSEKLEGLCSGKEQGDR